MNDRVFLDTSVVVYLFDGDSPNRQARAREILRADGESISLILSIQVLQEFYVVVTRELERPLPDDDALEAVGGLSQLSVMQPDVRMIVSAIELSQQHTISFWDALIVQAALSSSCSRLLSEDMQDGRQFGDLRVEKPFRD